MIEILLTNKSHKQQNTHTNSSNSTFRTDKITELHVVIMKPNYM